MCQNSHRLQNSNLLRAHPANVGERLATQIFRISGDQQVVMFTDPKLRECAVCVAPGSRLEVRALPLRIRERYGLPDVFVAQFIYHERSGEERDALLCHVDDEVIIVPLQECGAGVVADVLPKLGDSAEEPAEPDEGEVRCGDLVINME